MNVTKGNVDINALYDKVLHRKGYDVFENVERGVYVLPFEERDRIIPDLLSKDIQKSLRTWTISLYQSANDLLNKEDCDALMDAAFSAESSSDFPKEIPAGSQNAILGCRWVRGDCETPASLPDTSNFLADDKISVLNGDEQNTLTLKTDDSNINLSPGEAAFFTCVRKEQNLVWKELGQYCHLKEKIRTNPLIRDEGPMMKKGALPKLEKLGGEFFLPIDFVKKSANKIDNAEVLFFSLNSRVPCFIQAIKRRLTETDSCGCSILIHNPGSEHIIAARVVRRNNQLVCYLHEGLGQENSGVQQTRDGLCTVLREAFPEWAVCYLSPEAVMQRDFYSCGVFALKGLKAFRKVPDFDERIYAKAKELNGDDQALWYRLSLYHLPISDIPAKLLKMYQGNTNLISQAQWEEIVSGHDVTLDDYFKKHQREIPHYKSEKRKWFNFAAFGKRYKAVLGAYEKHVESDEKKQPLTKRKVQGSTMLIPENDNEGLKAQPIVLTTKIASEQEIKAVWDKIQAFAWGEACRVKNLQTCVADYIEKTFIQDKEEHKKKLFLMLMAYSFFPKGRWEGKQDYADFFSAIAVYGDKYKERVNKAFGSSANKSFIDYAVNLALVDNGYVSETIVDDPLKSSPSQRGSSKRRCVRV